MTETIMGDIETKSIRDVLTNAIEKDFFCFPLVVGKRGDGKTTLQMHMSYDFHKDWRLVFKDFVFSPLHFYWRLHKLKEKITKEMIKRGLPEELTNMLLESSEWDKFVDIVLNLPEKQVFDTVEVLDINRIKILIWDDIASAMHKQQMEIYNTKWFANIVKDMTHIRPYISSIVGSTPKIQELPKAIMNNVTDIIDCTDRGFAQVKNIKYWIRFKGNVPSGYYKLYDQDTIEWDALDPTIEGRYKILRHLWSKFVTKEGYENIKDELGIKL